MLTAVALLCATMATITMAQTNFDIELSNPSPAPGEMFSITFTTEQASALYYYGLEIAYDETRFAFSGVTAGELLGENPLQIASEVAASTIGASVVRTSGSGEGPGSVVTINFETLANATSGEAEFTISNADLRDTAGAPLTLIVDESITVVVPASETFTVFYNNPQDWVAVNAYAFESDNGVIYQPWPGEAMNIPDEGSVWYSYDIPVNFNRVIFNNGEGEQTDDLVRNTDGWYDGTQWYDSEPDLEDSRLVTFSVDMSVQAELGNFDVSLNDMVYVRGGFNGFSLDNPLTLSGDDIFEAEIEVSGPAGSTQEYKFFIEAGDGRELPNGGWELLEEDPNLNRSFALGEADAAQTLPLVFFNNNEGADDPEFVIVWPGDTNNDGVVNEEDVLPLGIYWNQTGPARANPTTEWAAQESEPWSPVAATYADTDGSGLINQTDLLAIGLNFGETHGNAVLNTDPVIVINVPVLNEGDTATITLSASQVIQLQGLSFAFEAEDVEGEAIAISTPVMGDWASGWEAANSLIEFNKSGDQKVSGARAHKGLTEPETASDLFTFELSALLNWTSSAQIVLKRLSYIDAGGVARTVEEVDFDITVDSGTSAGGTELPVQTALQQNYPNPFNPTTNIAYDLSESATVTIEVVNILGQRVALLVNRQETRAGSHVQPFDASRLTSGVYLIRMTAGNQTFTRKMMLVK